MPETLFRIRWPDGTVDHCYSPSSIIADHLKSSQNYTIADFMSLARRALNDASDRVAQIYGHPCSRALAQLDALDARQAQFPDTSIVTCLDILQTPKPRRANL
jgi:uncharacterized repeat protein (TIGR04042 family)